jgi:hypothetical protein
MLTYKAMLDGIKSYGLHTGLKPSNGEPMTTNDLSTNVTPARRRWHGPYYVYCLNAASSLSGDTRHGSGMWSAEKKEAEFAKAVSALPPVEYNDNGGVRVPSNGSSGAAVYNSIWSFYADGEEVVGVPIHHDRLLDRLRRLYAPVHTALTQTGRASGPLAGLKELLRDMAKRGPGQDCGLTTTAFHASMDKPPYRQQPGGSPQNALGRAAADAAVASAHEAYARRRQASGGGGGPAFFGRA